MFILVYVNGVVTFLLAVWSSFHQLGIRIFSYNSFLKSIWGKSIEYTIDLPDDILDTLNGNISFMSKKVKQFGDDSINYLYVRRLLYSSLSEIFTNIRIVVKAGKSCRVIIITDKIYQYFFASFLSIVFLIFAVSILDSFILENILIICAGYLSIVAVDFVIIFFILKAFLKSEIKSITLYEKMLFPYGSLPDASDAITQGKPDRTVVKRTTRE
jgi:hypothetical protein